MNNGGGVSPGVILIVTCGCHTRFRRHNTFYGLPVSDTDFGGFLSDTAVLRFDTDFN